MAGIINEKPTHYQIASVELGYIFYMFSDNNCIGELKMCKKTLLILGGIAMIVILAMTHLAKMKHHYKKHCLKPF